MALDLKTFSIGALLAVSACSETSLTKGDVETSVIAIVQQDTFTSPQSKKLIKIGEYLPTIKSAALQSNSYAEAMATIDQAAQNVAIAESSLSTQVSLTSQAGGIAEYASGVSSTAGLSANLLINKLISDGGASVSSINSSVAKLVMAESKAEADVNSLVSKISASWIDIWQYQERASLLKKSTQAARELVQQLERLVESGIVDKTSAVSAKIQLSDLEAEQLRLNERLASANERLAVFIERDDRPLQRPLLMNSSIKGLNLDTIWQQNPSLRASAASIFLAEQELTFAAAQKKPKVGLRASLQSPMSRESSTDAVVGLQVNWTLGDGGRRDAEIAARQANLNRATNQFETQKREVMATLSQMIKTKQFLLTSRDKINTKKADVISSQDTLKKQLATGQADLKSVIDIEIKSQQTADRAIELEAEIMKIDLKIAAHSGQLLSTFNISAPKLVKQELDLNE